jgi:signal transduction histidine kinase
MTVRVRLLLMLVAMTIVLAGPAVYSFVQLQAVRDIAFEMRGRHAAAWAAAGDLQTSLAEADRLQRSYLIVQDSASRAALQGAFTDAHEAYGALTEFGYAWSAISLGANLRALEEASGDIDRLIVAGDAALATDYFRESRGLFDTAEEALGQVVGTIDTRSAEAAARAQAIATSAATSTLLALTLSLVLAVFIGLAATERLTRPLQRLRRAMARVAQGDFDAGADADVDRKDELGDLARSFRAMTEQISELNRLKAEFVSRTSHNLKTPINVITGYSEMLQEGIYGEMHPDQAEALNAICEQVDNLGSQVRQLADLGRVEAGEFSVRLESIFLDDLLLGLQRSFEALSKQKNIKLEISAEPTAPSSFIGDEDRLRNEVLGNLLSNAFKFTPTGGHVTVRARGEDGKLLFEVVDSGLGIESDDLPRIFDRYYQSGNGVRASGSGLGLAIAREIVDRHGGAISAESEAGEGTSFLVTLPLRLGEPVNAVPSDSPGGESGGPATDTTAAENGERSAPRIASLADWALTD